MNLIDSVDLAGYPRSDGRKGIRNALVVAYLVECAHHVAREIALPFRDRDVHVIRAITGTQTNLSC